MCGQPDGSSLKNIKVAEIPLAFQRVYWLKNYGNSYWTSLTQTKVLYTSDIITVAQF